MTDEGSAREAPDNTSANRADVATTNGHAPDAAANGRVPDVSATGANPLALGDTNSHVTAPPDGNGQVESDGVAHNGADPEHGVDGNGLDPGASASPAPLAAQIEAVLFVTDGPVALSDLSKALSAPRRELNRALSRLAGGYDSQRGLRLQRTNGHVQLVSAPETAEAVSSFIGLERSTRLSKAALETLSIVAYRQPVTRPEIDELRGVDSDAVVRSLASRGLIEPIGRRDTVGHPIEYATTFLFLEYFGLGGIDDLPAVERNGLGSPTAIDA